MTTILGRVVYVLFSVAVFAVGGTIAAFAYSFVKDMLSGGGGPEFGNVAIVGFAFFGAIGGIASPLIANEAAKQRDKATARGADTAGWIVGIAAGLLCLLVLFSA